MNLHFKSNVVPMSVQSEGQTLDRAFVGRVEKENFFEALLCRIVEQNSKLGALAVDDSWGPI